MLDEGLSMNYRQGIESGVVNTRPAETFWICLSRYKKITMVADVVVWFLVVLVVTLPQNVVSW